MKRKNPKGTITLNEALAILKGKSNMEKMGLRIAAARDGFKSRHTGIGREKFLLDAAKFEKWVKDTIDAIPEGFILVGKAARELNITSAYVYKLIEKHKIETKKAGAGRGKIYIDFTSLQNVYVSRKNKTIIVEKANPHKKKREKTKSLKKRMRISLKSNEDVHFKEFVNSFGEYSTKEILKICFIKYNKLLRSYKRSLKRDDYPSALSI